MFAKIIVIVAMLVILGALLSSLIFLVIDKGKTQRTVKGLTVRIGLSLCLFIFLFIALKCHWIVPHDI